MEELLDLILDAVLDCLNILPFLFATVLLMEYIEHRAGDRFTLSIQKAGRFGPSVGALLGIVPQCGFSAACAHLFNGGLVSAGTVVAVFLSTSDEALPILISDRSDFASVGKLILIKFIIACLFGFLTDLVWPLHRQRQNFESAHIQHSCSCTEKAGWKDILFAALQHTASIIGFLFLVTLLLNVLIFWIGEDRFSAFLLPGPFQPVLAAVIGLIPNCAASVLLTKLYLSGMITLGSAVSGLASAAGIGFLVLLRGKRKPSDYLRIFCMVFLSAVISGIIIQLIS